VLNYEIEKSKKSEYKILKINNKYVYSKYNPIKYIERVIKNKINLNTSLILMFGIGLGYHIKVINRLFPKTKIFVFEPDLQFYNMFLNNPEKYSNTKVFYYKNINELHFYLTENIKYKDFNFIKLINVYETVKYFDEKFNNFIKVFRNVIETKHKNFWTKYMLQETWNNNVVVNLKHCNTSYKIKSLFGKFKNTPAIIIGAGPSLDKSYNDLKLIHNKAILIAVDTALKGLVKNNVKPDIVVTLDAQKENFNDFKGIDYNDYILVYDITVYPEILNSYKGNYKLFSIIGQHQKDRLGNEKLEHEPIVDLIKDYIPDTGYLQTGGSVSTNALDLARNMGCDPIVFVGQDLSYSYNKIHNDDSADSVARISSINKFNTIETHFFNYLIDKTIVFVKGNKTEKVITDLTMKHYINWFEDAAGIMKQTMINSTEGGAYLNNFKYESLKELNKKFKPADKTKILENLEKVVFDKQSFKNDVYNKKQMLLEVGIKSKKYIELLNQNKFVDLSDMQKYKEKVLQMNIKLLELYINKYYVSKKSIVQFKNDENKFVKYDLLLFFMNIEYGINKILEVYEKILTL
jgi:hypothetical protein